MRRGLALVLVVAWAVTGFLIGLATAPGVASKGLERAEALLIEARRTGDLGWREAFYRHRQLTVVCPEFFAAVSSRTAINTKPRLEDVSDTRRFARCSDAMALKR